MPSTYSKKIEIVERVFGKEIAPIIINKIKSENVYDIPNRSDNSLRLLIHPIADYIDFFCNADYSIIEKYTINEIHKLYGDNIHTYKTNLTNTNYIETNSILFDYRISGIGFYWIDYEKSYSKEMCIRMDNCGRVNYGDTLIELREDVLENTIIKNYSRVNIVANIKDNIIYQIKGIRNSKPKEEYYEYIYDFLINTSMTDISYVPQFEVHNDFRMHNFEPNKQLILRKIHPKLFINNLV